MGNPNIPYADNRVGLHYIRYPLLSENHGSYYSKTHYKVFQSGQGLVYYCYLSFYITCIISHNLLIAPHITHLTDQNMEGLQVS